MSFPSPFYSSSSAPSSLRPSAPPVGLFKTAVCLVLCVLTPLQAAVDEARALADLSLEELMNESVTSVSKKQQKLADVASAITVLSNEDLQRSGVTMLADALRLVPGVSVGALNASHRAVSARGFNSTFANKQLVLVDGRVVYTPLFSGVYWDLQQPILDDVERVEVIRGPGATVWGANAVNGVINILTKSARDTQGGLLYGSVGDTGGSNSGVRYGGRVGDSTYYRVYAARQDTGENELADDQAANDEARSTQGGARLDYYSGDGVHATWQAEALKGEFDSTSGTYNVHTLGRWRREMSKVSSVEAQLYFDRTYRDDFSRVESTTDMLDFSIDHTFALGERQHLIWGGGYRFIQNEVGAVSPGVLLLDPRIEAHVFNVFAQNEIKLIPDKLTLTVGAKVEHHEGVGFELQPSVRATFKPGARHTLWSAVSRAVRAPNIVENRDVFQIMFGEPAPGPGGVYVPTIFANPALRSEELWAYEFGYRIQPAANLHVEIATFYNDYRHLVGLDLRPNLQPPAPGAPFGTIVVPWGNVFRGETYGAELSATWAVKRDWRLTGTYSALRVDLRPTQADASSIEWGAPEEQYTLRSSHDLGTRVNLDLQLRSVSRLQSVPGYRTADVRLAWRVRDDVELSLVGRNLLDARHPEQPLDPRNAITSEVPRGFHAKVSWKF